MISCGMRRLYGEHALIKWSDGASPMANTRNVISDDVDLRVIWGKHAQLCQNPADTHRKTIVLFVFRNHYVHISYIITSPLSKISDLFVFRAFRAIKNSLRSLNIHRKVRRKVCRGAFKSCKRYFPPLRSAFVQRSCLRVQSHRNFDVHGSDKTAKTAWRVGKW